jgi:hypothetical protein
LDFSLLGLFQVRIDGQMLKGLADDLFESPGIQQRLPAATTGLQ